MLLMSEEVLIHNKYWRNCDQSGRWLMWLAECNKCASTCGLAGYMNIDITNAHCDKQVLVLYLFLIHVKYKKFLRIY